MRGALFAVLLGMSLCAAAASPAPAVSLSPAAAVEATGLRSIAGWLKARGTPGYVAAEVADVMGIPRAADQELIDVMQRGFRDDQVLRVAQFIGGEYVLFMVQQPGEVTLYLATLRGGLRKAVVSLPANETVAPLESGEAESSFRREVIYWEDKLAR
jgi:hypothetical protein